MKIELQDNYCHECKQHVINHVIIFGKEFQICPDCLDKAKTLSDLYDLRPKK